jgi:hypothetical protein
MRSSKKALWALGCVLVAGLTYIVVKKAKKAEKDINDQETQDKQDLAELGVDTETLKNHGVSLNEDLVRSIQQTIYRSKNWDDEMINGIINPDIVLEENAVLHLVENEFRGKKQLDFIFELPNYTEEAYKFPKIKDFKVAIDKAAEEMWAHKVVQSNKPYKRFEGYVAVNVIQNGEEDSERSYIKKIPCEWYRDYATEANDGVARFYEDYNDPKKHEELKQRLLKNFLDNYVTGPREGFEFYIADVFLGWRISFQVQGNNRGQGINLITAVKCIQYIVDEFEVRRNGGNKIVKYDHILFHEADGSSDIPANFLGLNGQTETYTY